MKTRTSAACLAAMLLTMSLAVVMAQAPAPAVHAEGAWVRQPAPSRDVTAAYVVIVNDGDTPIRIVGGESGMAKTVELHEMAMQDRMMKMRRVDDIVVPAKGRVALEPGGLHIMMFGVQTPLQPGTVVPLTLRLEDGSTIAIEAPVRAPGSR